MEVEDERCVGMQGFVVAGQYAKDRPDKIDASTWEVMHLKTTTYIRCFIDMSPYNNFNDETQTDDLLTTRFLEVHMEDFFEP